MMQRWKAILDWERSNKQNLNAEQLIARTRLAYNMAVVSPDADLC